MELLSRVLAPSAVVPERPSWFRHVALRHGGVGGDDVVERLRARSIFAHLNRRVGVYNVGVRVVIPDGREAIWDNDGAAGLEAMVLRDGVLVGFVPQIPDSDDFDAATIAELIAAHRLRRAAGSFRHRQTRPPPRSPSLRTEAAAAADSTGPRRWSRLAAPQILTVRVSSRDLWVGPR